MDERFNLFTVLINNISRSIRRIKTEEMAEFNLKSSHVSCIYYLYIYNSLTAKELCDISSEDKANISRSIEHLEQSGYIICKSDAPKRYNSPLVLTEKGKEIAIKISKKLDGIVDRVTAGLDDATRETMYKGLNIIFSNLQDMCDEYEC